MARNAPLNLRILVIDDDEAILTTYRSILQPRATGAESLLALLGENAPGAREYFDVVTASQGQVGVERVREALAQNSPFSVVFVDMRMPPGWDGLRTAQALRALDPNLYIVVASAYADYTADQIQTALSRDAVLLRKPFGRDEVYQLARTLAQGWTNRRALQDLNLALEARVAERAAALRHRLALGQVLAEISTRFATVREERLAHDLPWALEQLAQIVEVDRCYLALWEANGEGVEVYEHASPTAVQNAPIGLEDLVGSFRTLLETGEMNTEAPLVSQVTVVVPLIWGGQPRGVVGCEIVGRERHWPAEDVDLLTTSSRIIGRALENLEVARALYESEALFRSLAVSSPLGIMRAAPPDTVPTSMTEPRPSVVCPSVTVWARVGCFISTPRIGSGYGKGGSPFGLRGFRSETNIVSSTVMVANDGSSVRLSPSAMTQAK
ncbi:hypothetical protein CCP3SC1_280019 [Gammaproteobacteria bacterium]